MVQQRYPGSLMLISIWIGVATPHGVYRTCTGGEETGFTRAECHDKRDASTGCYLHAFDGTWRACAQICNNKVINTQDGRRCCDSCEEYIARFCQEIDPSQTTVVSSTSPLTTTRQPKISSTSTPITTVTSASTSTRQGYTDGLHGIIHAIIILVNIFCL